jgi:hypothetical protein
VREGEKKQCHINWGIAWRGEDAILRMDGVDMSGEEMSVVRTRKNKIPKMQEGGEPTIEREKGVVIRWDTEPFHRARSRVRE